MKQVVDMGHVTSLRAAHLGVDPGAYDYAGQAAGRAAADKARLDAGALPQS